MRIIRVVLRTPFSFHPVTINDLSPALLLNGQERDASLQFTIPSDFPADLFPLPIRIYTQGLYPAAAAAAGLQTVVIGGEIHYIYKATAPGVQTVQFQTNKSDNSETVVLKADYFIDGAVSYSASNYEGTMTYGAGNTAIPAGATVSATVGDIQISAGGAYTYIPSGTSDNETTVTLAYTRLINSNTNVVDQSFEEVHSLVTTVGALNNSTINLPVSYFRITGRIRYGNTRVPAGSTLTVTTNNGAATMLSRERYELVTNGTPANGVDVTISCSVTGGWPNYTITTYSATKSIGTLRINQYFQLQ